MEAKCVSIGQMVEGGEPYTGDYDEGRIESVIDQDRVIVSWQSGVKTVAAVDALRIGWSGRFPTR